MSKILEKKLRFLRKMKMKIHKKSKEIKLIKHKLSKITGLMYVTNSGEKIKIPEKNVLMFVSS